jgi:hypothetical protein
LRPLNKISISFFTKAGLEVLFLKTGVPPLDAGERPFREVCKKAETPEFYQMKP